MKLCPFLNAECVKGQCMAWVKVADKDADGKDLDTFSKSYCYLTRQG